MMKLTITAATYLMVWSASCTAQSHELDPTFDEELMAPFHDHERILQAGVTCRKASHGAMFICDRTTSKGNYIKYTIPCESDFFDASKCLTDGKLVCYQYNNIPCIATNFCARTSMYAMDCSNMYATSSGAACGITDCSSTCSVQPTLLDYNVYSSPTRNACWTAGATSSTTTSAWTHFLSDGKEIQLTVNKVNGKATSCTATVPNEGSCSSCSVSCADSGAYSSVSYDCSAYSSDSCAVMGCGGQCGGSGGSSATTPVAAPKSVPVPRPVSPPVATSTTTQQAARPVARPVATPVRAPVATTSVVVPAPTKPAPAPTPRVPTTMAMRPVVMPHAPYPNNVSPTVSQCRRYPGCALANLEGLCCPATDGTYLDCCSQNAPTPSVTIERFDNGTHWSWKYNTTIAGRTVQKEEVLNSGTSGAPAGATVLVAGAAVAVSAVVAVVFGL